MKPVSRMVLIGWLLGAAAGRAAPNDAFLFTITADSHLDQRTSPEVYAQTLDRARAAKPAFHIDLGDTFMTEKHANRAAAVQQYRDQRRYFDQLGVPVHLVPGNHDGECGRYLDGTATNLAAWSRAQRERYFPEPLAEAGRNYYAWEHANALFVVLDPYGYTPRPRRSADNWHCTLGAEQYRWLQRTLAQSQARFKFVFIHQLVGGLGRAGRGGLAAAGLYEWGGRTENGADQFQEKRPGWPAPIHQLLVKNKVTIVFHGHDHLYAKEALDGIVYQEVPQPGDPRGNTRSAAEYGYGGREVAASSGHLRVAVSAREVKVDYVRADGTVVHSYAISAPAP